MHQKPEYRHPRDAQKPTHFLVWLAAILCAVITVAIIIAGIVVFIGYLVIHPRVPILKVLDAHLNRFQYDQAGVLVTQLSIVVRSENDNMKAHASFSDFSLTLGFVGIDIAKMVAGPYDVRKNQSVDFNYEVTSEPIPLDYEQMKNVELFLQQDEIRFDLKGNARARWKVGMMGSVRFWCHLNCQLHFFQSNGTYIRRRCSSRAK